MGVYVHDSNWASRRGVAVIILILFHVILLWGLKNGFAMQDHRIAHAADQRRHHPGESGRRGSASASASEDGIAAGARFRRPVVDINIPMDAAPTTAITNVTDRPPPAPPAAVRPPAPPRRVRSSKLSRANQPSVNDYYPPTSQRLGEEGVAQGQDLRRHQWSRHRGHHRRNVRHSTRLDEAALKVAKLYRFNAVTRRGLQYAAGALQAGRKITAAVRQDLYVDPL